VDGGAVAQAGTNVTASISTGGGTLGGTTTIATDATGKASFTNRLLKKDFSRVSGVIVGRRI